MNIRSFFAEKQEGYAGKFPQYAIVFCTGTVQRGISRSRRSLGDGSGSFTTGKVLSVGNESQALVVGDFNGDGRLDLATATYVDDTVTVLLGNGNGTFTAVVTSPSTGAPLGGIKGTQKVAEERLFVYHDVYLARNYGCLRRVRRK